MFCFGARRGVRLGERWRGRRGGVIVAVSVCMCVCKRGGGGDGVSACQPDRASSLRQGQLGVSTRLLRGQLARGCPLFKAAAVRKGCASKYTRVRVTFASPLCAFLQVHPCADQQGLQFSFWHFLGGFSSRRPSAWCPIWSSRRTRWTDWAYLPQEWTCCTLQWDIKVKKITTVKSGCAGSLQMI